MVNYFHVYDDERCVCNLEKVCMRYLMQRRELKEISQTTKAEYSSQQRKKKLELAMINTEIIEKILENFLMKSKE